MGNPSPMRVAVDVVVARAMKLDTGYQLVHQRPPAGSSEWHVMTAVHPTTQQPLKDADGVIYERFRPIIGEN